MLSLWVSTRGSVGVVMTKANEVSSKKDTENTIPMKTNTLRHHCVSVRDSAVGPLFLLMLLAVSSFTSIVTELDAWRQVCSVAESIFVVIARPATLDAVVESAIEALAGQETLVKNSLFKTVVDEAQAALVCLGSLNSIRQEPPHQQTPVSSSDRPRGPPAPG